MSDHGGSELAELRQDRGLSQEELAERSGLSARSIGDLERGATRRPRRASLEALADALELAGGARAGFVSRYRFGPAEAEPDDLARPAQLPAPARGFAGRDAELARLDTLLREGARVLVLEGGAGMGKSELALQWAHRVRSDFPDGQLYAALRGFGAAAPAAPEQVLAQFLRALGAAADEIPAELDERAAALRSRLADRRVLLLLDDAADSAQVAPLLPGTAGCAVLITSRRRLERLQTRAGAARLEIGDLTDAAAVLDTLVAQGLAPPAGPAERQAALALCGGMPLALRLICGHLARSVTHRPPLDLMVSSDDPADGVRALLSWSARGLGPDGQALLAGLGLLPLTDVPIEAAAAACGWPRERARAAGDELCAVHLARSTVLDRVATHDLVHEYARELAAELPADVRAAALDRVELRYAAVALAAARRLNMITDLPAADEAVVAADELDDLDPAAWLRSERAAVVAVARAAHERGAHLAVRRLSDAWWRHLHKDMRDDDARALHTVALESADATGDRPGRGRALQYLGTIDGRAGRIESARARLDEAGRIAAELGRPDLEAASTGLLVSLYAGVGEFGTAIGWARRTLDALRRTDDRASEASLLNNVGMLHRKVGELEPAAEALQAALAQARELGDGDVESAALNNLGSLYREQGDLAAAGTHLAAALDAARRACNREGEGVVLTKLAELALADGAPTRARGHLDAASAIAAESGTPHLRHLVDNARGDWGLSVGELAFAEEHYGRVAAAAELARDHPELARACRGLGRVARAAGRRDDAARWLRQAADEHRRIGSPAAAEVEAELRAL